MGCQWNDRLSEREPCAEEPIYRAVLVGPEGVAALDELLCDRHARAAALTDALRADKSYRLHVTDAR